MGRKRTCELPFCKGVVEGTRNKRRCDNDRNIHLHQVISKNVKKIMRYIEQRDDLTANDVNRDLFKNRLDKNEKGSMYRLFQAMVREEYLIELGKREGLKVYAFHGRAPRLTAQEEVVQLPAAQSQAPLTPREMLIGKLREFVHMKNGTWNHDDWLWLINRQDIRETGASEAEIGSVLESEKARYWLNR
ncbi:MAG TPA: hypothetical protein PLP29_05285 [Candidatus Ozemobacteraceae bacterium]|nr:hypothetical protein [Candidatus Ozemobacteraceae bacterium]